MDTISTITERGQVVIPFPIRIKLNLKPSDKLGFEVKDNKIIASPITTLNDAMGMIKGMKIASKTEMKRIIRKRVMEKYKFK